MSKCEECHKQGNCPLESDFVYFCLLYQSDKEKNYSDKGGHKERSLFHAPQHKRHWNKEDKKKPPEK